MRFFLFFFFILGFSACSLSTLEGLEKKKVDHGNVYNPYFSKTKKDYVYKAKIKLLKNTFGGILIVKKLGEEQHRIVFTTEFGNKIFDFELEKGIFVTKFIVEDINKPLIIKALQKDFKTLIQEKNSVLNVYSKAETKLYQCRNEKGYNFYKFQADTLLQIIQTSKRKEKVLFSFDKINEENAGKIQIQHQNIQLQIDLLAF